MHTRSSMEVERPTTTPLNSAMTFDEASMERSKSFVNALQVLSLFLPILSHCFILGSDLHLFVSFECALTFDFLLFWFSRGGEFCALFGKFCGFASPHLVNAVKIGENRGFLRCGYIVLRLQLMQP